MKILLLLAILSITIYADKCGGNCINDCRECPCGNKPNIVDTTSICSKYKWDKKCCDCIIKETSGKNANAVNTPGNYIEAGLFLIDKMFWNYCNGGKAPCDPEINAFCAYKIYIWGKRWHAWSASQKCGCY